MDVTYSDQPAMTQMLLKMTGGTLLCAAAQPVYKYRSWRMAVRTWLQSKYLLY